MPAERSTNHVSGGLEVVELVKNFDGVTALDGLSLQVEPGTVFGLLGPNGAGKTTTIRIIIGILGADRGQVLYQGHPISRLQSRRFGYLPEERGLYPKTRLRETLIYLAQLKGLEQRDAATRVDHYLDRFDLAAYAHRNVRALSRGNQQKAQFIAAIVHHPSVVILDEPFTGLDPVNQIMLKEIIGELCSKGTTVLLSTHQMDQVERICDAICLIDAGRTIIAGPLDEIKASHTEPTLEVTFEGDLPEGLDRWVKVLETHNCTIIGHARRELPATLEGLVALGPVIQFKMREATLEDIFIEVVRECRQ
ncbi:MAG: ATP-binding cassette domain-containing protein [Candidatus Neomarinimicrobiota bacterium]